MSKARCKHFAKHTSMKQYKSTGAEERWNIFMNRGWSYWQEVAPALGRDSTEIPSRPGAVQEDDGPCWTIWCSALSQASHVCLPVSSEDLKVNFRTLLPCYLYLYFFFFLSVGWVIPNEYFWPTHVPQLREPLRGLLYLDTWTEWTLNITDDCGDSDLQ